MKKPLIALTMDQSPATDIRPFSKGVHIYYINDVYVRYLEKTDCLPLTLPTLLDLSLIPAIVDRVDGLLLTGGDDVDPYAYGEKLIPGQWRIDPARTTMELALIKEARKQNKPLFAICRGCQMLNVALGGTLYQDIPRQYPNAIQHHSPNKPNWYYHEIRIFENTQLWKILKTSHLQVTSSHHQAIKTLASVLQVSSIAEDGMIEAVEDPELDFFLGVQWHPETMADDSSSMAILQAFLSHCRASMESGGKKTVKTVDSIL